MRAFGRRLEPHHDPMSRAFPARTVKLQTVMHEHVGPVLDQADVSGCTGFAVAQALNTGPHAAGRDRLLTELDALALYAQATILDPWPGAWPGEDTGSSGLAAAKAATRCGFIRGYRHAFGLRHVLGALVSGPVIIGVPWSEGMMEPDQYGQIIPGGKVVGGHEVTLIGLDVGRHNVAVLNSWGPGWGIGGKAWMGWTVLEDLLKQDGDATTLEAASV